MVTAREEVLGAVNTVGEPGASCAGDPLVRVGKRRRHSPRAREVWKGFCSGSGD